MGRRYGIGLCEEYGMVGGARMVVLTHAIRDTGLGETLRFKSITV